MLVIVFIIVISIVVIIVIVVIFIVVIVIVVIVVIVIVMVIVGAGNILPEVLFKHCSCAGFLSFWMLDNAECVAGTVFTVGMFIRTQQ